MFEKLVKTFYNWNYNNKKRFNIVNSLVENSLVENRVIQNT